MADNGTRKGLPICIQISQKNEEPKGASKLAAEVVEMADGLVQVRTENLVKSVGTKKTPKTWGDGRVRGLDGGE